MKGKGNMIDILSKKDFYKMMLRDRYAIARMVFPLSVGGGKVEFYSTPLGTVLRAELDGGATLKEIKLYDKSRGSFVYRNAFCGDEIVEIDGGVFVSVSGKLQIEDVVGREFFLKIDDVNIIARAEMIPRRSLVDKTARLVYN